MGLIGAGLIGLTITARAQTPEPAAAGTNGPATPAADSAAPGTSNTAPDPATDTSPAFVDRLLDGGRLAPDIEAADPRLQLRDSGGWPRSLSVVSRLQSQRASAGAREDLAATQWRATLDTPNHGALGLEASTRWAQRRSNDAFAPGTPAASFALSQRQLPLEGGWQASHFLGSISTLNTELAREAPRQSAPTRWMRGAAGQWQQAALGLSLHAGVGDGGVYDALGQGGLRRDGARLRVAGLQIDRPYRDVGGSAASLSYGAQIEGHTRADGTDAVASPAGEALWQSLRWRGDLGAGGTGMHANPGISPGFDAGTDGGTGAGIATRANPAPLARPLPAQIQGQWLLSRSAGRAARAGWFDAALDDGPVSHRLGLQRLGAGAQWLGATLGAGTESLMYRWRWLSRRDTLELQFDGQHPIAGGAVTRQWWTAGRRQLDLQNALGAQLTQLDAPGGRAWQAFAYVDAQREPDQWRAFVGAGRDAQSSELAQLGLDWNAELGPARWSATGAVARVPGQPLTVFDAAGSLSSRLSPRWSLDTSLRGVWTERGDAVTQNLQASVLWALATGWTLEGSLGLSRSRAFVALSGPSGAAAPLTGEAPALSVRSAWIGLRYDFAGGAPELPLGGPPGVGGAALEGVLFLDANANGRLDPGEARAPNVTVVLDGRYGTRTDEQGRYRFAFVAAGRHQLGVISDNLPLPWQVAAPAGTPPGTPAAIAVEIRARQPLRLDIGALREAP